MTHEQLIGRAIRLSVENVAQGGGPFGAVVARGGEIVAEGVNRVTALNDPTAHAEVNAIRHACSRLKSFKLTGCTVYSSCEPCPMCLSALYWAGVKKIYFGNTKEDAAAIDFSDNFIYEELAKERDKRELPAIHVDNSETIKAFQKWAQTADKIKY